MLFGVLLAVFTQVFRIGSEVPNYPVLLLFNIVLFGFFQEATRAAVTSIVSQESVVRKTQFPRLVIPLAVVAHDAVQPRPEPGRGLDLHPRLGHRPDLDLAAAPADRRWRSFVITTAVSMILSSLYPRFRDMAIIWSVALHRALLRDRPCSTRSRPCPATLRDIIMLNPLAPLLELARKWVIDPSAPGPRRGGGRDRQPDRRRSSIYVGICVLAVWVFKREAPRIAEQL